MGTFGIEATVQGPASPEGQSSAGMGDIVNLRKARRKAVRQAAERNAAANRLLHGRSKAERELETLRDAKARNELDRHRIVTEDER
jgi:Domain of unknown function (DUF4169)